MQMLKKQDHFQTVFWRIDFKISELVVGELTRWRNDRLP